MKMILSYEDAILSNEDAILSNEDAILSNEDAILSNEDAILSDEDACFENSKKHVKYFFFNLCTHIWSKLTYDMLYRPTLSYLSLLTNKNIKQ